MKRLVRSNFVLVIALVYVLVSSVPVESYAREEVLVTAQVPGVVGFNISGFTSPFADVTLVRSDKTTSLGTYASNKEGEFVISSEFNIVGITTFCIYTTDINSNVSPRVCFDVDPDGGLFEKVGLVLPPTIRVEQDIDTGEVLVFGYTIPNAMISVYVDDTVSHKELVNSHGYYEYSFEVDDSLVHTVSTSVREGDLLTPFSEELTFTRYVKTKIVTQIVRVLVESPGIIGTIARNVVSGARDILLYIAILTELSVIWYLERRRYGVKQKVRKQSKRYKHSLTINR